MTSTIPYGALTLRLALGVALLGAISVHAGNGWLFSAPKGGWEYPAFWAVALVAQALIGPGAFALRLPEVPGRRAAA